ncbi:MAG: hypothetical protein HYX69_12585 [Planctomycetia bacterium]|nr:hypothetical protein [Planctomycetia bacterium]
MMASPRVISPVFKAAPALVPCALFASLAVGCGRDGIVRVPVEGTVRYQGQPVQDGQIRFVPQAKAGGPVAFEPIKDGKYRCTEGGGVPVGKLLVEIYSWDPNTPPAKGPGGPPRKQFVPPKYNEESELAWTLEKQRGTVTKDFDLP